MSRSISTEAAALDYRAGYDPGAIHPVPVLLPAPHEARQRILSTPRAGTWLRRRSQWTAWLLGFFVLYSPYVLPSRAEQSPRVTDVLGVALMTALAIRFFTRGLNTRATVKLLLVALLVLPWILRELFQPGGGLSDVLPLRWLLALPYAYVLWQMARDPSTRYALAFGLFWGAVANLGVVALQAAGYSDVAVNLGLASGRWATRWGGLAGEAAVRPNGMWGHANASTGVIALCFPVVCGLVDEGRLSRWWVPVGLLVVGIASAVTLTRSATIVSVLVLVLWASRYWRTPGQLAVPAAIVALATAVLFLVGPPGGWERWQDPNHLSANAVERVNSTLSSLDFALEHPLGIGSDYNVFTWDVTGGVGATHNAWVFLAVVAGIPLTLVIAAGVVRQALVLRRRRTIEGWLALQCLGLFLFEEFFRNSVFTILALWLFLTPVDQLRAANALRT
ncbi:MAG: O-antigen ligase family protein [Gemmatimonadaceae bacterium]